jgi:hypothetical protein
MIEQNPSYFLLFVQGLGNFTGVFLGVVAGTAVTILVHLWFQRRKEKGEIRNLKFELNLNIEKIKGFIDELVSYRNAVNGDSFHMYFGYFKLSAGVSVTTTKLFTDGVLYKYLSHDHIGMLQEVFNDLTVIGENYMNNQITQRREALMRLEAQGQRDLWTRELKPQVVNEINFWDRKFKGHVESLKNILKALPENG